MAGFYDKPRVAQAEAVITVPATEEAKQWEGWGTALKPAVECWILCRKPLREANVASQVLNTGTGAINIDGCRVKHANSADFEKHKGMVDRLKEKGGSLGNSWKNSSDLSGASEVKEGGRWPANLVLSHGPDCKKLGTKKVKSIPVREGEKRPGKHSMTPNGGGARPNVGETPVSRYADPDGNAAVAAYECAPSCPVRMLDEQSGVISSGAMAYEVPGYEGQSSTPFLRGRSGPSNQHGDSGGASRFFQTFPSDLPFYYTAKASRSEKSDGLNEANVHPTVKSLALMAYLVRLVTPKDVLVLDPFAGSGSTLVAAVSEGMRFIGVEREAAYHKIALSRVKPVVEKAEDLRVQHAVFDEMFNLPQE